MKQRDIILVPFPFSDQTGQKVRPALVLSNDRFNQTSEDVIVCAITTTLKPTKYTLIIEQEDLEDGTLYEKSAIKAETLLRVNKTFALKTIGTIKQTTFSKVITLLAELFKP